MNRYTEGSAMAIAAVRGVAGGVIMFGSTFFSAALLDVGYEKAALSAGASAFSFLAIRFGLEGFVDSNRKLPPA